MKSRNYFLAPALMTLLCVSVGTAASAHLSLPGDSLYPVKTKAQELYLGLALTDEARAKAALSIAESKIEEMEELENRGASLDFSQAEVQLAENLAIASSSIASRKNSGKNVEGLTNAFERVSENHDRKQEKKASTTKEKVEDEKEKKDDE